MVVAHFLLSPTPRLLSQSPASYQISSAQDSISPRLCLRKPGVCRRAAPEPIEPFVGYLAGRFLDDPHPQLTVQFDEVARLFR
jgi:hypothetical protein